MNQELIPDPNYAYVQSTPAYFNHEGIIDECGAFASHWGDRSLISGGRRALKAVEKRVSASLKKSGIYCEKHIFSGECCDETIFSIVGDVEGTKADVIIGVGGGKALDAAKAAAEECGIPIICIPTISN